MCFHFVLLLWISEIVKCLPVKSGAAFQNCAISRDFANDAGVIKILQCMEQNQTAVFLNKLCSCFNYGVFNDCKKYIYFWREHISSDLTGISFSY